MAKQEAYKLSSYFPPPGLDGWRVNTDPAFVRSLGVDPDKLEEFLSFNMTDWPTQGGPHAKYTSCIVIKDGWIIGERYNRPDAKTYKQYLSSNGKSYAIALFGILASEFDVSLSDLVYDKRWLPEGFPLSDPRKSKITFEQILRHTSGICPESGQERGRNRWVDYVDWVVGRDQKWGDCTGPLAFDPGSDFRYSSVAFCHIALVVPRIANRPTHEYLWDKILEPIGVTAVGWERPPDRAKGHMWFSAGGVQFTPRDYARFGYLLMHRGRWGDKQIIPADFLAGIMAGAGVANIKTNGTGFYSDQAGRPVPKDMFRIGGSGLNWLFAIPSDDLICLRTSRVKNSLWGEIEKDYVRKIADMLID